jgi:hypothetical protein
LEVVTLELFAHGAVACKAEGGVQSRDVVEVGLHAQGP